MRKFGIRDCGGALRRLTLATGLLTACALWMDEPAYAACTPASASGVTVSCTGTTTNQGGGAPGTSAISRPVTESFRRSPVSVPCGMVFTSPWALPAGHVSVSP